MCERKRLWEREKMKVRLLGRIREQEWARERAREKGGGRDRARKGEGE